MDQASAEFRECITCSGKCYMLIDASGHQLMSVMGCMSNTKLFFWLGDGGETYSVHSAERGSNLLDFDTYI